jgi:hypothetical protein
MNTTRIGLLGDTHGDLPWVKFALRAFKSAGIDVILQVGDFGLYRDRKGNEFMDTVQGYAKKMGITFFVIPGNHENWEYIEETVGAATDWVSFRKNIYVPPRVFRWNWDGVDFASLSGAPSVNRTWAVVGDLNRKPDSPYDRSWYPGEAILPEHVQQIAEGGYADVMVGHDAPYGVGAISLAIHGNPHGFPEQDIHYAHEGRMLMTEAFNAVAPRHFFHGHYHIPVDERITRPNTDNETTHILGLNMNQRNYSLGEFNLTTREATNWNVHKMLFDYRSGKI